MKGTRDFQKVIDSIAGGELVPPQYQMSCGDLKNIITRLPMGGLLGGYKVLLDVFCFGYVMGHRATVNGKYIEIEPLKERGKHGRSEKGCPA